MDKERKGCFIALGIYIIIIMSLGIAFQVFNDWVTRHPKAYCDEIDTSKVQEYNPKVCKLRYPILNSEEIKNLKKENEELKTEILSLQIKIENINKSINDEIDDNWEPDPPDIVY